MPFFVKIGRGVARGRILAFSTDLLRRQLQHSRASVRVCDLKYFASLDDQWPVAYCGIVLHLIERVSYLPNSAP